MVARSLLFLLLSLANLATAAGTRLEYRPLLVSEAGILTNVVWSLNDIQVSFVAPAGWRMRFGSNDTTLTWLSPDSSAILKLSVSAAADGHDLKSLTLREEGDSSTRVLGEFKCYTKSHTARAVDFQRIVVSPFVRRHRLALVALDAGRATVELDAPADRFAQLQFTHGLFLNSLQINSAPDRTATVR